MREGSGREAGRPRLQHGEGPLGIGRVRRPETARGGSGIGLPTADDVAASWLMLRSRGNECAVLDGLLDDARASQSGMLALRGEAGVGKNGATRLRDRGGVGLTVVRAAGVASEMELAFAALHQLSGPLLDRFERLPRPQRDAPS